MFGVNGKTPSDKAEETQVGSPRRFKGTVSRQFDSVQLYLRDIEVNPLLTASEELQYGRLVQKGDQAARKKNDYL